MHCATLLVVHADRCVLSTTAVLLQSPYSVQARPDGAVSEEYRDAEAFEPEREYSFS
jgi:hypothetical protein